MQLHSLAFLNNLMGIDGLVLLLLGLLIFGRRLPEVGKNIGQTIVEFKKGLSGKTLDEPVDPDEPTRDVPVNRNLEKRNNRVTARPAKSLPSTEEV